MFLQGYIYTEPTAGIVWQAPAAGGAIALFYTLWCAIIVNAEGASSKNVPYDTIFRFSPRVDKYADPPNVIWIESKKQKVKYLRDKQDGNYREEVKKSSWPHGPVTAIIVKEKEGEVRYEPVRDKDYTEFRDADGWTLRVHEGTIFVPTKSRWGRFLANLFLNFMPFAVWFVCLWLRLRFQWGHALGLAVVMWLILTLAILPMIFEQAGIRAQQGATSAAAAPKLGYWPLGQAS